MSASHALYRFYATNDTLLYIGITMDPGARWKQHSKDKEWWQEVVNVTVEQHPTRESVLEAERAAIIAERPKYNVVHNRGTVQAPRLVPQLERLAPIQVGDWIALGLSDGRCPVGEVAATDETWVSVRLKDFWDGGLLDQIVAVRWEQIERVELAYLEDATEDRTFGAARVMNDKHLGEFQSAWKRAHFGVDGKDLVEQARCDIRREDQLARTVR